MAQRTAIGEEKAESFAFADAGIDPVAAYDVDADFTFAQGQFVYKVEFIADGTEYKYLIKASDGAVVKKNTRLVSNETTAPEQALITLEQAKEKALSDAGLTAAQVTFTEAKLNVENGKKVYDIDFETSETEYDYEIDAVSGAVLKKETEPVDKPIVTPPADNPSVDPTEITLEEAKAIALADAKLKASEVTFTKAKLDIDDGRKEYDIEFVVGNKEYSYEISLAGKILDKDIDIEEDKPVVAPTEPTTGNISVAKAKEIALTHAGLTASQVTFEKAKLEKDDGIWVYDVEFFQGRMEYEYTIRASDGEILEHDKELDD